MYMCIYIYIYIHTYIHTCLSVASLWLARGAEALRPGPAVGNVNVVFSIMIIISSSIMIMVVIL